MDWRRRRSGGKKECILTGPLFATQPIPLRRRFQFNTVSHFSFSSFGQFLVRVWKKELVDIFFRFQGDGTTTLMGPTQLGKNFPKMCFDSGRTIFPAPKVLRFPHFDPDFFFLMTYFSIFIFPAPSSSPPAAFWTCWIPRPAPEKIEKSFFFSSAISPAAKMIFIPLSRDWR